MSWSIEECFVRAASLSAVVVQGIFDALTHQPNPNSHPIPGCPDAVECRTHGCAGNCSESMEAEEACDDPRPPGFYTMMDPEWADLHYGFPYPPADKERHVASDGGVWVFNNLGADLWDAVSYPTGEPRLLADDPLLGLRDRLFPTAPKVCLFCWGPSGQCGHVAQFLTSPAVSADSGDSAAETGSHPPESPSAACTDPSPNGDEGPAGDSTIPPEPPAGHLRQQQAMCPGCGALLDVFDREHAVTAVAEVFAALHADCLVDEEIADVIRRLFPVQK